MKQQPKPLKTRQEIAEEIGISPKTLYRKIKKMGIEISKNTYLTISEQKLIYALFEIDKQHINKSNRHY